MKCDLKAPCKECPFRTDVPPYITQERAEEILNGIVYEDTSFTCHKTLEQPVRKMCAGGDGGDGEVSTHKYCQIIDPRWPKAEGHE